MFCPIRYPTRTWHSEWLLPQSQQEHGYFQKHLRAPCDMHFRSYAPEQGRPPTVKHEPLVMWFLP